MDELNTNTIKTAYRFDSNGYFLGTDSVMEDSEGNLLLPSDDTMLEPELKEGYWSKWNGAKWESIKKPTSCEEVISSGLSVISNAPDAHSQEVKALIESLVENEKDIYRLHIDSSTLVQTIEKIPEPTPEEKERQEQEKQKAELDRQIADIRERLADATLLGDEEWIAELQAAYRELIGA